MVRQFTKNQVKKLPGHGWFTKPLLVLRTKSKKSHLVGKVLKQYRGAMTAKEGVRIRRLIDSYSKYLTISGIPVIETRCVLVPTKNGKYKINQVQPFVAQEAIMSNYLATCNKENAIDAFKQTIEIINKMEKFNRTHSEKIGLGPKPSNFAVINGKVTLIDLYPPQVKNGDELQVNDLLDRLRNKPIKKIAQLVTDSSRRIIQREINKHWDTNALRERVLWHFSKRRPELIESFIDAIPPR